MLKLQLNLLAKRLLFVFAFYTLARLLFLLFNHSLLNCESLTEIFKLFFYSLRFDAAAIAITNSLFIILSLIPIRSFFENGYQRFLKSVFLITNIPCLFFNILDVGYYRFQLKRTTADFFKFVTLGDDLKNILPKIIADFWYLLLIFLVIAFLFSKLYSRIKSGHYKDLKPKIWLNIVSILVSAGLIIIAARGGIQLKPLSILSAAKYASTQNVALVLNTPFSIIKTIGKEELPEVNYFEEAESQKIYSPLHHFKNDSAFSGMNVVFLIMESFSKEYIGYFNNGKGYTPFLDSLITQSLVCTNAFANGKRSIEGIPAILSGIPTMMNTAYITSTYNGNSINSLPVLLKSKNYSSAFYHGGNNGTMGFDSYTRMVGYDKYIGRNEYPGNDYDGDWGVYDEPFMQFFCKDVSGMKQPFHAALFSLSSHHPYSLPEKYKTVFTGGTMPIYKTISYADLAMRNFFESAQKTNWYHNTLFVITADHTGPSYNHAYQSKQGVYAIPIIYFKPGSNLKGVYSHATQHADIVPSVLDYLDYDLPFKFYGESVFDTSSDHFAINYIDGIYQYITDSAVIHFDGERTLDCFANGWPYLSSIRNDSSDACVISEKKLKAFIQDFNYSMIYNKCTVK